MDGVITERLIAGRSVSQSIETGVALATEIADGLDASHSQGIVHRDMKPGNIFLTYRGQAKLLDFGLAKVVEPARDTDGPKPTYVSEMTKPGSVFGTMGYMSPEQVRGEEVELRELTCFLWEWSYMKWPPVSPRSPGTHRPVIRCDFGSNTPIAPIQCNPDFASQVAAKSLSRH